MPQSNNLLSGNISEGIQIQTHRAMLVLLGELESGKYVEQPILNCWIDPEIINKVIGGFKQIPAAGGIVKNTQGELLFIRRFGRWDLPKGMIEAGENPGQAAIREVEEECGLSKLSLDKKVCSTYHVYRSPYLPETENWVWKETHWYEMSYDGNELPVPQTEEEITEVRWFKAHELDEVLASTYGNLKELVEAYLP